MKRILFVLLLMVPSLMWADEGMWLLSLIGKNYAQMQKQGFMLTPEDIYNVNQGCLKDAVVGLGNEGSPFSHFCTGEIISDEGLVTTNHHCGYEKLQEHSTVQHDYLRDGFWAYSKNQELPNPGLTASVLVRMEDVTDRVVRELSDNMSEADRKAAIDKISQTIVDEAKKGTIYDAAVRPVFNGNQFFLFVHIIYKDVRLVGAPPSSMGNFGGDADNWAWPRHTCDFSMFRIYAAPDGSPAAYDESNVPLHPKHHLPVSIRELKDGDFAMVLGFPGSTNRFLTSYGIGEAMEVNNKLVHELRTVKIEVLKEEMNNSQAVHIKYAAKYASCSNYWKYTGEQNKALDKLGTADVKRGIESDYRKWAKGQLPKYSQALSLIQNAYDSRRTYREAMIYLAEGMLTGVEMPFEAYRLGLIVEKALQSSDADERAALLARAASAAAEFYKDYDEQVEKRIMKAMYPYVYARLDRQYTPEFMLVVDAKKGIFSNTRGLDNFDAITDDMFSRSVFATEERFNEFIKNPTFKVLYNDPAFIAGEESYDKYQEAYTQMQAVSKDDLSRGMRDFTDGVMRMSAGSRLWAPDANSTIRCSYGNVRAYDPADGVSMHYYTTLDGVMQKEDPDDPEFVVPARLKELYKAADYGRYANAAGKLPTCFITTNDITGGNSGSPVINGRGELIGLAFDGNGEAMSGDIDFEENLQRCICLDTRYMLWVIDKFAGATNLIEEMDIVK